MYPSVCGELVSPRLVDAVEEGTLADEVSRGGLGDHGLRLLPGLFPVGDPSHDLLVEVFRLLRRIAHLKSQRMA